MAALQKKAASAGVASQLHHVGVVDHDQLQQMLACGDVMLLPVTDGSAAIEITPEVEAAPLIGDGLTVTLDAADVNLRSAPTTASSIVAVLPGSTSVSAMARTGDGGWIQIQSGTNSGWVAASLIDTAADLATLPVVNNP